MTDLLAGAARLRCYRSLWGRRAPRTLDEVPPLSPQAWRRAVHRAPGGALLEPAALWTLHPVPGEEPCWIAFGHDDLAREAGWALRVFRQAGVRAGDVVLAVAPEGPWAGNALPYLMAATDSLLADDAPLGAEVLPLALLTTAFKPDLTLFPFGRAPSVLLGSTADLRAIADLARMAGAAPLRCRLGLITDVGDHDLLAGVVETRADLLALPGALAPFGGQPGRGGIWLPADRVTAEVVLDDGGRAAEEPARSPGPIPAPAAVGRRGELVVTIPNGVLPVVRFRTRERVRILEGGPDGVWISRLSG